MVLDLLHRDARQDGASRSFAAIRDLVARCHEPEGARPRLLRQAAVLGLGQRGTTGARGGVDDRQVQHGLVGADLGGQVEQQVVGLVDDLGDPGVGAVDLVDQQDHRQTGGQRLAQHEPGLRQRALARVDQQHDAVDHGQPALDLAAEVGVAGGVDDVDRHPAPVDRGVLGQDRDALLALQVAGVHDPVDHGGPLPERAGGAQHRVDERRLAVVDVRHDGDVAQLRTGPAVGGGGEGGGG